MNKTLKILGVLAIASIFGNHLANAAEAMDDFNEDVADISFVSDVDADVSNSEVSLDTIYLPSTPWCDDKPKLKKEGQIGKSCTVKQMLNDATMECFRQKRGGKKIRVTLTCKGLPPTWKE
jgi:hypothetical protein